MSNGNLLFNSGHKLPQLGFGTFAVEVAISSGFRRIDCSMIYGNEKEVDEKTFSLLRRYSLHIWDCLLSECSFACELSIKNLGVQYLGLYLIHHPVSFQIKEGMTFNVSDPSSLVFEYHELEDTWKAMKELVSAGHVKSIGVSNFNKRQIERILASCTIPPAVNQVEVNIHWLNTKLVGFRHSKNIEVEGYGPLGSPGTKKYVCVYRHCQLIGRLGFKLAHLAHCW
ncbi:aldo keto reductase [Echinococcus multilocularis]|uniref:Aldo keto reductase n=1 Tax=Echinococcus multilocularis TaxID=6211 RepID=A0A087VZJ2_ECHMU|nr:aldo keto reductase [Echinococcus multilocularis]